MRTAVVVANGEVDPLDRAVAAAADLLIAADGGSRHCAAWGLRPQVVVGDLDSGTAPPGADVERHPAEKDETDLQLAIAAALARGATRVRIVGALGGERADHAAANLLLLTARSPGAPCEIVRGRTRIVAIHGPGALVLEGSDGDTVSLLPVGGDAAGISTDGLRYALRDGVLSAGSPRGLSNVIARAPARVTLSSGILLVFELGPG